MTLSSRFNASSCKTMDHSSPENVDDGTSASQGGRWETPQVDETPDTTEQPSPTNENDSDQPQKPSAPMQKRRRVTRACDECRRKKIKCDGKQPCTHCTVYSYGAQNIMPLSVLRPHCTDVALLQNVHTISRQTVAAMLHHSISRR